jgi:hypothetical protein
MIHTKISEKGMEGGRTRKMPKIFRFFPPLRWFQPTKPTAASRCPRLIDEIPAIAVVEEKRSRLRLLLLTPLPLHHRPLVIADVMIPEIETAHAIVAMANVAVKDPSLSMTRLSMSAKKLLAISARFCKR